MTKNYFSIIGAFLFGFTAFSQNTATPKAAVTIPQPANICYAGGCTSLQAFYYDAKETTSYAVNSIPYQNLYPYTGGTVLNASNDDVWSPTFTLPFTFCFYGVSYNSLLVGSNGVITFEDASTQIPGGFCAWDMGPSLLPSATFPIKNAIYGVYQDTNISSPPVTNPMVQNVNYYIGGIAPNRYFVANFNELPPYLCGTSVQTSQVVLFETTNIIEVFVQQRTPCPTWSEGRGVIGVMNGEGTLATVPPGRNTGNWTTTNEAWRFLPAGNSTTSIAWEKNGVAYSTENPVNVCTEDTDTYTATVTYASCSGPAATVSKEYILSVTSETGITPPADLHSCSTDGITALFDLSSNSSYMMGTSNPGDYAITYYSDYQAAVNYNNDNIVDITNYSGINDQIIYAHIESYVTSCRFIKPFTLLVDTPIVAPSGDAEQSFTTGETLADIELSGSAVNWYAAAVGGEPLPTTTPLVSGTTYYAELAVTENSCTTSGRAALAERLAITVYDNLSTPEWAGFNFKAVPNPVKDVLTLSSAETITTVAIYNLLGQQVISTSVNSKEAQINMSALSNGTYLMKVSGNKFTKSVKVIKE